MSSFNPYNDTSNKIKFEGQQITLTTTKVGPSTVQLNWNLPYGLTGCDKLAYNGIVITVNNVESSLSEAPIDGTTYTGDPTVDSNLHAGDKINSSMVVLALYDDVTTISATISGLVPKNAYFFTAHAVDAQNKYHTEGVHAYSQTYGSTERPELPGYTEIRIGNPRKGSYDILKSGVACAVQLSAPTNLVTSRLYDFKLKTNACGQANACCDPYTITVSGNDAQTYEELIDVVNSYLVNLCGHPESATPPNVGYLYFKSSTNELLQWDGYEYTSLPIIISSVDPQVPYDGQYWLDTNTNILYQYNLASPAWEEIPVIEYYKDPTSLDQTDYWFNGTTAYKFEGSTWCEHVTIIQNADPSEAIVPVTGTYWFNSVDSLMYGWSEICEKWTARDVIVSLTDPNTDTDGNFWFNTDTSVLNIRDTGAWGEYSYRYEVSEEEPNLPSLETMWVDNVNDKLYARDITNTTWEEVPVIFYHVDPIDRDSCQLWWNSTNDDLYVWDVVYSNWVAVQSFIQSATDPTTPLVTTTPRIFWYNPDTTNILYWDGSEWVVKNVIISTNDPMLLPLGTVWYSTTTETYYERIASPVSWSAISPFAWEDAPGTLELGVFWKNGSSLYTWNGLTWVSVLYNTSTGEPIIGFSYYNTVDDVVYKWTSTGWTTQSPPVTLHMTDTGSLIFQTSNTGSSAFVEIIDKTLFIALPDNAYVGTPVMGLDNIPGTPTFMTLGVGTDGSTDERRNLVTEIQKQLGWPAYKVELSKEQYDTAIRLALEQFRRKSASAYKRVFFFLQIKPGRQQYELSDKTVGYNKIVNVMAAYRIQSSFLGNATGQGAYGQAMLQHLYQMGSFDLLSYHLISDYVELMNQMFAAYLVFTFNERTRILNFHQTFGSNERVLLDAMIERTEQDLLTDRIAKTWIETYALGRCQLMLAEIRGKYASLPGAGGGVTLNATELQTRGEMNLEWCEEEIDNFLANEIESVGMGGDFILG